MFNTKWWNIIYRCRDCGRRFHTLPAFKSHLCKGFKKEHIEAHPVVVF